MLKEHTEDFHLRAKLNELVIIYSLLIRSLLVNFQFTFFFFFFFVPTMKGVLHLNSFYFPRLHSAQGEFNF